MQKKFRLFILVLIIIFLAWFFVSKDDDTNKAANISHEDEKIQIVSSLFPWHDLAQAIGGDRVESSLLLSPGISPHAFEPTPSDMLKIAQADLFVYTGKYLEPWADKLLKSLDKTPRFLVLGQDLNTLELSDDHGHEEDEEDEHQLDPHIWLDPILMIQMAANLTTKLVEIDPASTDYYASNLESYKNSLEQLDADFKVALSDCRHREVIYGGHYAFGYLANRYNLEYEAAQGFSPDAESTPSRLAEIVDMLKEHETSYLFASKMENPQLAETLAQEAQIEVLTLHTVHNLTKEERDDKLSYEDLMRLNLDSLKLGLQCR
jgi:zinc transport system substrate-binding protein